MNPPGIPAHFIQLPDGSFSHPSRVPRTDETAVGKRDSAATLVGDTPLRAGSETAVGKVRRTRQPGKPRRAGEDPKCARVIVRITCYLKRLLDGHDNLRIGLKPLVDAIAETICIDDADGRIVWEYGQQKTAGEPCVAVVIEST
jgi:hypothetical protein